MRNLVRNGIILLVILVVALWSIYPPSERLRLGKDLAGGMSLVYGLDIRPGETDVQARVIEVVKERVDPQGVLEISIVAQGPDRIEITMPLPTARVKELRQKFEAEVAAMKGASVSREDLDRAMALAAEARTTELERLAGGDAARAAQFGRLAESFDRLKAERESLGSAQKSVDEIKKLIEELEKQPDPESNPQLAQWRLALPAAQGAVTERINAAALVEIEYETSRDAALVSGLDPVEVRRALQLPDREVRLVGKDKKLKVLPSPRQAAINDIRTQHPAASAQLDKAIAAWGDYEKERRSLDDPQDLVRILRGAGVLNFRITVDPGTFPDEAEARNQIRIGGPRAYASREARWLKVNKVENWIDDVEDLEKLKEPTGTSEHFRAMGYIAERYRGQYYMLCWDQPGLRLTQDEGAWQVDGAFQGADDLGRSAINFRMDGLGARALGQLTEKNVGKKMAVILDDEVYTAPNLRSRIAGDGQITGSFDQAEIDYIVRVLGAGSLKAKLSQEPLSVNTLSPTLGADNLRDGLWAGVVSLIIVAGFMLVYYFGGGVVAILALLLNALLIVAAMSLNHAAFSLPGIAGIILTFGQAVDANVLIYERMREELERGLDLKTSVRLGYDKALSAIVDGNVTTLIVCLVLGVTGTQEIKGFALTLGLGIVATLFAQLFFTRWVYAVLIDQVRIRRMPMLTLVFPAIQRAMTPSINWLALRPVTLAFSALLIVGSIAAVWMQGVEMLSTEFRGGTAVTLQFKPGPDGRSLTMKRGEVQDEIIQAVESAPPDSPLQKLRDAEVIAVNAEADNITSSTFRVRTVLQDSDLVQRTLVQTFSDRLESRPALGFEGAEQASARAAPVFPITSTTLGPSIDLPANVTPVPEFYGGAAVVLRGIDPPAPRADIEERLRAMRLQPDYQGTIGRKQQVVVLEGTDAAARSVAIVVSSPELTYFSDERAWQTDLRDTEWALARAALTQSASLSNVEQFGSAIAKTFRAKAIQAILISCVLVVIYVWVRFGSLRYSMAAIVTSLHDSIIAVGLVAVAGLIYNHSIAASLGILPFKFDLNLLAAILTNLGYSLNSTIVIMDRIRENRGKLPFATGDMINLAVNQTISRTIITAGTTLIAVAVLYILGGEGIRAFAYVMLIGVIVGTYSSHCLAPLMVWQPKEEARPRRSGAALEGTDSPTINLLPAGSGARV